MSASGAKRGRAGTRTRAAVRSLVVLGTLALTSGAAAETWRGLEVAPEHRCSPYHKKRDYPYLQSVEREIVRALGQVYGPYTGRCFASTRDTDIEHIVATSEAQDYVSYCTSLFRLELPRFGGQFRAVVTSTEVSDSRWKGNLTRDGR